MRAVVALLVIVESWYLWGSLEGVLNYTEVIRSVGEVEQTYSDPTRSNYVRSSTAGRTFRCVSIPLLTVSGTEQLLKRKVLLLAGLSAANPVPITFLFSAFQRILNDTALTYLLKSLDFTYIPVVNLDAFEDQSRYYDIKQVVAAFANNRNGTGCAIDFLNGVSLNRNFDYKWSKAKNCSSDYGGWKPFSEAEAQAIADLYREKRDFSLVMDFDGEENEYWFPFSSESKVIAGSYRSLAELRAYRSLGSTPAFLDYVRVGTMSELRNKTSSGALLDWAYLQGGFTYKVGLKYQPKSSIFDLKQLFDRHWAAFKTTLDYISPLYAEVAIGKVIERRCGSEMQCLNSSVFSQIDLNITLTRPGLYANSGGILLTVSTAFPAISLFSHIVWTYSSMDFSLSASSNATYTVIARNSTSLSLAISLAASNRSEDVFSLSLERVGNATNVLSVWAAFAPIDYPSAPRWLPATCFSNRSFPLYKPIAQATIPQKRSSSSQISGVLVAVGAIAGLFLLTAAALVVFCIWRHKRRPRSPSLKEIDPTNISIQVLKASN